MHEALVFLAGFVAAFIGSMSGGGAGFFSFAALIYVGLPPKMAVATNTFGDFGFFPPAIRNFKNAGQLDKKALPAIIAIKVAGASIGTLLIIHISEGVFNILLTLIMIGVVVVQLAKRRAVVLRRRKPKKYWPIAYFGVSIAGGLSNVGMGIVSSLTLLHLRGFTPMQALANSFFAQSVSSGVKIGILFFADLIDYRLGAFLFAGNLIGAHFGSKIAIKRGNKFIGHVITAMALVVIVQLVVTLLQ